jgi:signal transduction histidine kinase
VTRSVTDADLSARIPVDGDDEVAELASTFNAMMERLEGGFDHQRRFLDDVAHELRTPITIIQGHLDLLGDDAAETESTVALVSDELARMNRYVNELLVLAQAERPDFLHLSSVDLDLFVSALHRNASQLAARNWVIDQQPVGVAEFDEQRIAQALLNLADNAARHTQPGDEIGVGVDLEPGSMRCWVRDTGSGIEAGLIEDVFSLHVVGELSRSLGGSGLGLPIVAAIAQAHGGELSVESRAGAGATFTIEIPLPVVAHHAGVKPDDLSKGRS